jgi:hypothetical protein
MVTAVCQITRKGHSDFIALRKDIMRAMNWRRGDHLVGVVWEDQVIFRKLPVGAVADQIAGAMLRRATGEQNQILEGPWNRKRGQSEPQP